MQSLEIRPRFREQINAKRSELLDLLAKRLKQLDSSVKTKMVNHHIILKIPDEDAHFWSPELELELLEEDENQTTIKGIFGPSSSVWLMFVFFYSLLGFIALIVMLVGFAQLNLGLSAQILWALPAIALLVILIYATAKIGQSWAKDQTALLVDQYHALVDAVKESATD